MEPSHPKEPPTEQGGRPPKGDGWDSPGAVKWMVVGVVVLAFLGMFRGEIGRLVDRIGSIEVGKGKIEIKTVQTPLGRTEVSTVAVTPSTSTTAGIHGTTYVSDKYGFQISWPDNGQWTPNDTLGRGILAQLGLRTTADLPIAILRNEMMGQFRPNVNVVTEPVGTISVRQYLEPNVNMMRQAGWQILSYEVDDATQGGLLVVLNPKFGGVYQFQRYVLADGRAFVVTASQLPPVDQMSTQLRQDLLGILNSFRVLKTA